MCIFIGLLIRLSREVQDVVHVIKEYTVYRKKANMCSWYWRYLLELVKVK